MGTFLIAVGTTVVILGMIGSVGYYVEKRDNKDED